MKRKKYTRASKMAKGSKLKKSNYARKREHILKHGGMGFDYKEKPWK